MPLSAERQAALVNALSIDVEDYFQVQALSSAFPRSAWETCAPRVERNVERLLEVFAELGVHGTFFTLGWVAERHGAVVRRIAEAGHELASHGPSHGLEHARVDSQTPDEFRADVARAKALLEDCAGVAVKGYRAATFSVGPKTPWAFRILEEEGYAYSSSVYPVAHDNYANPDAPRFAYRPEGTSNFWEFPISTLRFAGRNFPVGGGGYFRFFPYPAFRAAIRSINSREHKPAVFYLHPWEIDPDQPRPSGLSFKSRFRHYLNLSKTEERLVRLLKDFSWDRIDHVLEQAKGA